MTVPMTVPTNRVPNHQFHLDCWRHARDYLWWGKVSPETWRSWLTGHEWTRVDGKCFGSRQELWQHTTDAAKRTGLPTRPDFQEYGHCMRDCALLAIEENFISSRKSCLGDVLYELLNTQRAFAACVCILDLGVPSHVWSMTTDDGVSLVGGKLEPGESSLEAAVRELREESGAFFHKGRQLDKHHLYRTLDGENEIVDTFVFDIFDRAFLGGNLVGNGREGNPGWNPITDLYSHKRYGEYNRGLIEFIKGIQW